MSEVLDFNDVSVVRANKDLLSDISWQVQEGERWIVLGPNGAGKSTLMNIAAARMHPTRGSAGILGEQLGRVDVFELRPMIGLSSSLIAAQIPAHETALNVVLTAAYGYTGRWRELYEKPDERRAFALLHEWGMSTFLNQPFGKLSEGERKRVLIARALMTDPELLILDEPAAGLDLAGRENLVRQLGTFAQDEFAPALILVTHHLEEIPAGFTHVLMLNGGKITAAGEIGATLTEENLRKTYDLDLALRVDNGRYSAFARH
ncbi:ABC transporter ATP-binding protein [Glutamicibacter sp. PS]|uniref:ABC transporter ATP-binding protein n=1 Tax=Glutamicibacter sp. PS TaxID=3075634 RepID=UPI00285244E1|nr:ABC transporter ATP-binding protein [Glutamicibacter sp. PS]MDR4532855.1 ABC transporter ATP-binding protein [Glutamicibacter sp. PS]